MSLEDTRFSQRLDIIFEQGATLNADNATFTVKDAAGNNKDLSGYSDGELLVKTDYADPDDDAVLSFKFSLSDCCKARIRCDNRFL